MKSLRLKIITEYILVLFLWAAMLGAIVWLVREPADKIPQVVAPPSKADVGQVVESTQPQPVIGLPVRLLIPSIEVDAAIQYVGLTADGAMGVPNNLSDVAWYQLGPKPGEAGNAVIAGHHSSRSWVGAVFDDLVKLQPGDNITIVDDRGTSIGFVVRESRIYEANTDPAEIFASSDSIHLNLITCTGKFNMVTQSFSQRLIVFADISR